MECDWLMSKFCSARGQDQGAVTLHALHDRYAVEAYGTYCRQSMPEAALTGNASGGGAAGHRLASAISQHPHTSRMVSGS